MAGARYPLLGVEVTRTDTSPEFAPWTEVTKDGVTYVYLQADEAIGASTPVKFATGFQVTESGNAGDVHGVSTTTAVADTEYAWFAIRGNVVANVAASTAAGADLARVSDANGDLVTEATATNAIVAVALTAESGGLSTVRLL